MFGLKFPLKYHKYSEIQLNIFNKRIIKITFRSIKTEGMEKQSLTEKEMMNYINSIAILEQSGPDFPDMNSWVSKTDGSYLTFEGLHMELMWMKDLGITEQIQSRNNGKVACIGFNPVKEKWYGWSHRAVFGFGIGSKVKKGDAGYQPDSMEDFISKSIEFWTDEYSKEVSAIPSTNDQGEKGVQVTWIYTDDVPNESLRGTVGDTFVQLGPKFSKGEWGKGEWTAETLDDAKQMAIDFAASVS